VRKIAFWLLAIAGDLPLLKPLILAIGTGMRPEELLGLRWKHVDLNLGAAHLPLTKNGDSRPLSRRAVRFPSSRARKR
jgi:integrase